MGVFGSAGRSAFPFLLNVSSSKKRQLVILQALYKYSRCGSEVSCWHSQPYRHRDVPPSVWKAAVGGIDQERQLLQAAAAIAPALPCAGLVYRPQRGVAAVHGDISQSVVW